MRDRNWYRLMNRKLKGWSFERTQTRKSEKLVNWWPQAWTKPKTPVINPPVRIIKPKESSGELPVVVDGGGWRWKKSGDFFGTQKIANHVWNHLRVLPLRGIWNWVSKLGEIGNFFKFSDFKGLRCSWLDSGKIKDLLGVWMGVEC